jgi:integrase/recombinase XerD
MTRTVDPSRRCLHVRDWPACDQSRWTRALTERNLEDDDRSPAAGWRTGSVQTNREGYGRWINFLIRSGADLIADPADRVTPSQVRRYLAELRDQRLCIRTQCNRIAQLLSVMRAIAPERDWSWLTRRFRYLDALANESRRQPPLPLMSGDILHEALEALNRSRKDGVPPGLSSAVTYRNWLMVAMAALLALRRHNLATLSIERHMRRVGDSWLVEIPPEESKTLKPITMPIPQVLHPHIELYLEQVRPCLLAGRTSDRLWITVSHTAMTDHSLYIAMTNFTRKVFGKAINPHRYRHIGATTVVVGAPERLEAARAFLSHGSSATTQDNYIIGQSVAASRCHADLIARLRRSLPGAKRTERAFGGCSGEE